MTCNTGRMPCMVHIGKAAILEFFQAGEFEKAIGNIDASGIAINDADIDVVLSHFHERLDGLDPCMYDAARQLRLRIERLSAYRDAGCVPDALIPSVVLPDGYRGKILLVGFSGGVIGKRVCLRSNDLQHRDILRNAELEVKDLGLHGTRVWELGGAHAETKADGTVRIWGGSGDYGSCDKSVAADLLRSVRPGISVIVEN